MVVPFTEMRMRKNTFKKGESEEFDSGQLSLRCVSGNVK